MFPFKFIFVLEAQCNLTQTPFLNLAFFVFPILFMTVLGEILLRKIPNDYSYKNTYLEDNSKNLDVLFLGNSHLYFGVNPYYIKANSFNAANTSQTLDLDLAILDKFKTKLSKLKIIIVPVDYFSLYSKLETSIESWRMKNYFIYFNIGGLWSIQNNSEVFGSKLRLNLNRLYEFYIKNKSNVVCSDLGWGVSYNSKNNQNLKISGEIAAKRHMKNNDDHLIENINNLNEIISFAIKIKAKVVFLTCPAHKSYVNHLERNQLNTTIHMVKNLSRVHKDAVVYINLLNDRSFKEIDFYDADHLNEIGAKKLSLKIDSLISSIQINNSNND